MSLILDGTNGLSDVDGTAAAPAIRGTDANTGIFFPAADTIAFAEGGAEVMRIDSAGNVGIGTTSPRATFEVTNATNSGWGAIVEKTAGSGTPNGLFVSTNQNSSSNFLIKAAVGTFASSTDAFLVDGTGALKFNSGYGSAAVAYGCRAWVDFDGTGTPAIRGSGNVSSITDIATGSYTVNFTTSMPDVNFAFAGSAGSKDNDGVDNGVTSLTNRTVSSVSFNTRNVQSSGGTTDYDCVNAAIFR